MSDEVKHHVHESPVTMLVPIVILGFGSLVVGTLWSPLMEHVLPSFGSHYFQTYLAPVLAHAQGFAAAAAEAGGGPVHTVHEFNWAPPVLGLTAAVIGLLIARWFWLGGFATRGARLDGYSSTKYICFRV